MKIKITYQKGDNIEGVLAALSPFIKKISFSDRHAPYLHAYLTVMPLEKDNLRHEIAP